MERVQAPSLNLLCAVIGPDPLAERLTLKGKACSQLGGLPEVSCPNAKAQRRGLYVPVNSPKLILSLAPYAACSQHSLVERVVPRLRILGPAFFSGALIQAIRGCDLGLGT